MLSGFFICENEEFGLKIGIFSHLNKYMKIREYKKSRSFLTIDPGLILGQFQQSPQKSIGHL